MDPVGWLRRPPIPLDDEVLELEELEHLLELAPGDHAPAPEPVSMRPGWQRQAACKGRQSVMLDPRREHEAKALCATCPAARDCLSYATDQEVTHGVWGGLTFPERCQVCPVCLGPKEPSALACNFGHNLLRLGRLAEQQEMGDPDVRVSNRQRPSARTYADCIVARGRSHSTARAYKEGCRCMAARLARREEERERVGLDGPRRGVYRVRETP